MEKEAIIYFDNLGFGWVLDPLMLKELKLSSIRDDIITDRSLIKIIENILSDNPII
ncbi:MAG: hypothetical protein JSW39_00355 [Desulfobacterales bacterium]|nr:MAG: hypothetical protein JSW39_00355 [Desulfobacterales bacterium]